MNDTPQASFATNPALLAIDDDGAIHDCDEVTEALFGYRRGEIVGRHISVILPELKRSPLVQDGRPSPRLRFLCRIGHLFEGMTRSGRCFASELFLNCLGHSGPARLRLIVRPVLGSIKDPRQAPVDAVPT